MRIIVEVDGQRMEIQPEQGDVAFSAGRDMVEIPCDCPKGDCGYVHRRPDGPWSFELSVRTDSQPMWEPVS